MNLFFLSTAQELNKVPVFTNDAIVLGILIVILAIIFHTHSFQSNFWKKFYTYVPALLLCYFIPALLNWPLGLAFQEWFSEDMFAFLQKNNITLPEFADFDEMKKFIKSNHELAYEKFYHKSKLYHVASRYLLPAALVLLCLGVDFKGIIRLGPKSIIMFLAGTLGIILGGPIALLLLKNVFPSLIPADLSIGSLWQGMTTIAGSWIGGGANQTAMKEIYEVPENIFGIMIVVDVIVANIWMGFLLYGANIREKANKMLNADNSSILELEKTMQEYEASVKKMPTTTDLFILMAFAFGGVVLAHWGSDLITPFMGKHKEFLDGIYLQSLGSGFFWLIAIATLFGLGLSFTKARQLEGVGATRWGSVFIYILVATIGMKMDLAEIFKKENLGLFVIGFTWMLVHVLVLLGTAKLIRAPFFFVAVGSQANVGGAASAPIVASAFNPSLASVGALMAVLGYAIGTIGAILCAILMEIVAGGV